MVPARRKRLLELADEYGFIVVEDDPYGRLRYEGGHVLPLKALSDDVVYLGTVSKVFAPGLRTGWIVAPKSILARINLVKQGTDLCGSAFNQVVVEHYFTDTPWQKTLQKFVSTYRTRRDAMLAALDEYFPAEATWTRPEGGFFVWVTLPDYVDTASMLSVALEHGVTYTPGDGFFPGGTAGKNCMRIAFCYESPPKTSPRPSSAWRTSSTNGWSCTGLSSMPVPLGFRRLASRRNKPTLRLPAAPNLRAMPKARVPEVRFAFTIPRILGTAETLADVGANVGLLVLEQNANADVRGPLLLKGNDMGLKVAVLMGGASFEREFSLASGKQVCAALEEAGHKVVPLDTTSDLVPTLRSERPDVAYIALHGKHGEDGTIQSLLEFLDIPFVGSPASVCRSTWKQGLAAHHHGNVPRHDRRAASGVVAAGHLRGARRVQGHGRRHGARLGGGARDWRISRGREACARRLGHGRAPGGLPRRLGGGHSGRPVVRRARGHRAVVEGVEMAVSILGTGWDAYALPPVEIVPKQGLYDTAARLDASAVDYYAPVRPLSLPPTRATRQAIRAEIERAALEVYRAYGLRELWAASTSSGTARRRGVFETNVSPGMNRPLAVPCRLQGRRSHASPACLTVW